MRLIDADLLKEQMESVCMGIMAGTDSYDAPLKTIDDAPTIDAVPVVRCRDCEFWGAHLRTVGGKYGDCSRHWRGTRADFYCGWGSRSDETN